MPTASFPSPVCNLTAWEPNYFQSSTSLAKDLIIPLVGAHREQFVRNIASIDMRSPLI